MDREIIEDEILSEYVDLDTTGLLMRMINNIIKRGKKGKSERVFFLVLREIKKYFLLNGVYSLGINVNKSMDNLLLYEEKNKKCYLIDYAIVLLVLQKVVNEVKPVVLIVVVKKGGKLYKVPVYVRDDKAYRLGIQWIIKSGYVKNKYKGNKKYKDLLVETIIHAYEREGVAVVKKEMLHDEAINNRVYLKFLKNVF